METNNKILVNGIELERVEGANSVDYWRIASRVVDSEAEAKPILAQAIKLALELDPNAVNEKYGLGVGLIDTYKGINYLMVARVRSNDEDLERFMSEEFPETIERLDNGVEISYGMRRSGLPAGEDFED